MRFTVELEDEELWAVAQFLKRAGLDTYRQHAASDAEAYRMQFAMEAIRQELTDQGYRPR